MSSTNRSRARDEHIYDYYVTPIKDIELFLKAFQKANPLDWNNLKIIDTCAGGNNEIKDENGIIEAYHNMSYPKAIENVFGSCNVDTYDIRENSFAIHKCDYLKTELEYKPDVCISNPPFFKCLDFIKKALSDVKDDGYVIMLLRLNFFGSKERKSFFNEFMPEYCFVHHSRIGFTDKKDESGYIVFDKDGLPKKGGTDSIEYAHFVWRKGYNPEYTKTYVI